MKRLPRELIQAGRYCAANFTNEFYKQPLIFLKIKNGFNGEFKEF